MMTSWTPILTEPAGNGEKARPSGRRTARSVRILGLDPGSRYTGYGIVDREGNRFKVVTHGRISLPVRHALPRRLVQLAESVERLAAEFEPDLVVLESLFRGVNVRSLIVLAQARGALLTAVARRGLEIREYSPAEIKSAVTGSGRADKEQVSRMVRLVLGLGSVELSADASDALAAAVCCGQRQALDRLVSRS